MFKSLGNLVGGFAKPFVPGIAKFVAGKVIGAVVKKVNPEEMPMVASSGTADVVKIKDAIFAGLDARMYNIGVDIGQSISKIAKKKYGRKWESVEGEVQKKFSFIIKGINTGLDSDDKA